MAAPPSASPGNAPTGAATIDTARLRLRPRAPADLEAIVAMDADPAVRRSIGGPLDSAPFREEVRRNIAEGRPEPHASWAIEWRDRPPGPLLGLCGLGPSDETGHTQIGWRLLARGGALDRRWPAVSKVNRTKPRERRRLASPCRPRGRKSPRRRRALPPADAAVAPRPEAARVREKIDVKGSEAERPRAEEAQAGQAQGGGGPVGAGRAARATNAPDPRQEKVGRGLDDHASRLVPAGVSVGRMPRRARIGRGPRLLARSLLGAAPTAADRHLTTCGPLRRIVRRPVRPGVG